MRQGVLRICIILLSVSLFGCSDPVPLPPDKADYIGLWVAPDRYISIFSNGRLEYKEKLGFGMHNRTQGNFEFKGNTLDTAMFASYIINEPPHEVNGQWKMVVDGVAYVRTGPPRYYGRSSNWPEGIH